MNRQFSSNPQETRDVPDLDTKNDYSLRSISDKIMEQLGGISGSNLIERQTLLTAAEVNVKSRVKEEAMKKFIYVTVALMLMLIFIGCMATMTPEQRKERYDSRETYNLTEGVGNKPFVGSPNNLDARGQFSVLTW